MSSTITVSVRNLVFTAVAAIALVLAYLVGAGQAGASAGQPAVTGSTAQPAVPAQSAAPPQIVMTGKGEATGVPDQLRFSASVHTTAVDVSAALSQANATTRAVLDAVHAQGVANADVQTTGLNIRATYDYSDDGPPTITGYAVSQSMSVLVRSLPDAGATISAAADAGGNAIRLSNIRLQVGDVDGLMRRARDDAMADATAKAQQYAEASGRSLGEVLLVTEDTGTGPVVAYRSAELASADFAAGSVPIRAGSADTNVTVSVVWSLE